MSVRRKSVASIRTATRVTAKAHEDVPTAPPDLEAKNESSGLSLADLDALRRRLLDERSKVAGQLRSHLEDAISDTDALADESDLASRHQDQAWLLRLAEKERNLVHEIENALRKMADGTYGVCEGTGEPIGFRRLLLRPWAKYSVQYKEMLEREQAGRAGR